MINVFVITELWRDILTELKDLPAKVVDPGSMVTYTVSVYGLQLSYSPV